MNQEQYYTQVMNLKNIRKNIHVSQGKLWYISNKERKLATQKKYNNEHKEKISEYRKQYYKDKGK